MKIQHCARAAATSMYSLCPKLQIFLQAYKFKKIQENSGKFNTVPKPPAGPVCIPSVVNCNFFLQAIIAKSYVSLVVVAVWLRVTYTYHILVHICIPTQSIYGIHQSIYYAHFYAGAGTQHRPAFAKSMYMYYKGVPSQCGFNYRTK